MRTLFVLSLLTACKKSTQPQPAGDTPPTAAVVEVVKGPLDEREYAYFVLPNGLKALAVHDPDTDMAAASLEVHQGHYADPADREGLAHFLEHMLFMGTDEFPEVDAYSKFVADHGGWTNAGTGGESTGYFFQIEAAHLEGALDRFSRFFVAPKLDPHYVDRERNAVNSEYSLKIKDHARRIREVRKQTMNQEHPESKFSVGNLDTLADRGEDTVHKRLLELYGKAYSPERMTFAIIGNEPVSVLKAWTLRELSGVPGTPATSLERPTPFTDEHLGVRIDMAPLAERRLLELQFVAGPEEAHFPKQPHTYALNVLGHEGEGTLFAKLKAKGWIESLSAGGGDGADDYDLLVLGFTLTKEGASHIDEIITATFDAIELLGAEGLTEARHKEDTTLSTLAFKFGEERPVVQAVNTATWAMSWVPPEHILDFWAVPTAFDADLIRNETLSKMTVDNLRVLVTLPEDESGATLDQLEERYQVKYGMRAFTDAERAAYAGDAGMDVKMPAANPYLPGDTTLAPGGESPSIPVKVEAGSIELWHLHDTSFGVPRAQTAITVHSDAPRKGGLEGATLSHLYTRMIDDSLEQFAYPIQEAGLSYRIQAGGLGMSISIFGYDDRQGTLLDDLSQRIRGLQIDPERFEIEKRGLIRDWKNTSARRPINQASWAMGETLDPDDHSVHDMLPVLEKLTVAQLEAFAASFFDNAHGQVFIHGNLTTDDAKSLAATVESTLLANSKPLESLQAKRRTIPDGEEIVRTLDIDHDDSTLMVRYQDTAVDLDAQARWRLLASLAGTPFYTQLRTEQQLGYVVSGRYGSEDQLPGVTFSIQSTVAGPITLLDRVDTFLEDEIATLKEMSEDEFKAIRTGVSARLRESKTQLRDRARLFEYDLDMRHLTFDRRAVMADRVDTLNKTDLVEMWEQVFLGDSGRLIVRSFGKAHAEEKDGKGCKDEACAAKQLGDFSRDLW